MFGLSADDFAFMDFLECLDGVMQAKIFYKPEVELDDFLVLLLLLILVLILGNNLAVVGFEDGDNEVEGEKT